MSSPSDGPFKSHFAVILAGGSGTRLWPLSSEGAPKHLLELPVKLSGPKSLLQLTVERVLGSIDEENVVTVTRQDYARETRNQLREISPRIAEQILAEPVGRNTLPAIAWAVFTIAKKNPQSLIF